jgi:hypothetical protein
MGNDDYRTRVADNLTRGLNTARFNHAVNSQFQPSSAEEGFATKDARALLHRFGLKW